MEDNVLKIKRQISHKLNESTVVNSDHIIRQFSATENIVCVRHALPSTA